MTRSRTGHVGRVGHVGQARRKGKHGPARTKSGRKRGQGMPALERSPARAQHKPAAPRRAPAATTPEAPRPQSDVGAEQLAVALARPPSPLRVGEWLWTTREGAERDLIEELLWRSEQALRPRRLGPALVASAAAPPLREGRLDLTFARQGFAVTCAAQHDHVWELAEQLTPALRAAATSSERHALQVFVPDSAQGNGLSSHAQMLRGLLEQRLSDGQPEPAVSGAMDEAQLRRQGGLLVQVCVCDARTAALGCIPSAQAQSLWPGGRARMRLAGDFPSRAARKLAEALAWLGMSPGSGELCVDLGAAPGGWSWLLLEKRARVIAVDPARMDAKLMRNPRLRHVQANAFDYQPEEPVDWLFCDMAYRPLEVAQMLGRWARRRQTRLLVANFKLPMKRKVAIVERIRGLLSDSGFASIRTRQLYHDREEITLTAHVR